MFKAVRRSQKDSPATKIESPLSQSAPALPGDLVNHIAGMSTRFRDLSALSLLSTSWSAGCNNIMDEVRRMAIEGPASVTEPILGSKCMIFAQDFAIGRLRSKTSSEGSTSASTAKLLRNLLQLIKVSASAPAFSELAKLFFDLRNLDKVSWDLLVQVAAPKTRAMHMLALDPDAKAVISAQAWDEISIAAQNCLELFLEGENVGGGALCDYPKAITKFGKGMTPEYGSPFHRILFASLLYRPKAFYELIQLAAKCNAVNFFEFSERVRSHFHQDRNVLVTLELTTARWFAEASEDDFSSVPYKVLLKAINQVYNQYSRVSGLTVEQKEIVEDSRRHSMLGIATKAEAIIKAIPKDQVKSRQMVLEPLMRYLREQPDSDESMTLVKNRIKAAARKENWLPGNPNLKFFNLPAKPFGPIW
jgi:hypothetical protein